MLIKLHVLSITPVSNSVNVRLEIMHVQVLSYFTIYDAVIGDETNVRRKVRRLTCMRNKRGPSTNYWGTAEGGGFKGDLMS